MVWCRLIKHELHNHVTLLLLKYKLLGNQEHLNVGKIIHEPSLLGSRMSQRSTYMQCKPDIYYKYMLIYVLWMS